MENYNCNLVEWALSLHGESEEWRDERAAESSWAISESPKDTKVFFFQCVDQKKPGPCFFLGPKFIIFGWKGFFVYYRWVTLDFCTLNKFQPLALGLNLRRDTYLPLLSASKFPSQHWTTVTNCYDWSGPGVVEPYVMAVWDCISCCSCSLA